MSTDVHSGQAPEELNLAARIRAALAFAKLTDAEAATLLNVSSRQVGRYKAGDWKKDPPTRERLDQLATATGVPRAFFDVGWEVITEPPTVVERLEALESQVSVLLKRTGGAGVPPIPGETGRRLQDDPPTRGDHRLRDSESGSGDESGTGG